MKSSAGCHDRICVIAVNLITKSQDKRKQNYGPKEQFNYNLGPGIPKFYSKTQELE